MHYISFRLLCTILSILIYIYIYFLVGKDATEEFEDVGHGSAARLMLDEYYVGEIEPSSTKKTIQDLQEPPKLSLNTNHKENTSSIPWILLLSIAILGSAIAFHFYS